MLIIKKMLFIDKKNNFDIYFYFRIILILPEIGFNIFGTLWAFSDLVKCSDGLKFSKTVIEGNFEYIILNYDYIKMNESHIITFKVHNYG